jgi:hypothetical protein
MREEKREAKRFAGLLGLKSDAAIRALEGRGRGGYPEYPVSTGVVTSPAAGNSETAQIREELRRNNAELERLRISIRERGAAPGGQQQTQQIQLTESEREARRKADKQRAKESAELFGFQSKQARRIFSEGRAAFDPSYNSADAGGRENLEVLDRV